MQVMNSFSDSVREIGQKLDMLSKVCKQVMMSERLKSILENVLIIGNIMNEGTRRATACLRQAPESTTAYKDWQALTPEQKKAVLIARGTHRTPRHTKTDGSRAPAPGGESGRDSPTEPQSPTK